MVTLLTATLSKVSPIKQNLGADFTTPTSSNGLILLTIRGFYIRHNDAVNGDEYCL